jgi:hypothetical protein
MKKVIRLTESDLTRLVRRVIKEQSIGTISLETMKEDPKEWFSNFPCIKNLPADQQKIVGGKIYNKTDDGKRYVFLPETGTYQEKGFGDAREQALNDYVGKIQGGGLYYCHKTYTSKGLGPQIMPPVK